MLSNKADMLRNGVNVIGYFQCRLGQGETARLMVASLQKQSIPHTLISADFLVAKHTKEPYAHAFDQKGKYAINLFCMDLVSIIPFIKKFGVNFIKDHYNIILFFWETNVIPADRLKLFAYFDEVWVTTRYNQECLSSVIPIPVHRIPHPLQLNYTQVAPNKASFGLDERFTFLFCFDFFSIFQRKNPSAIIKAFQKAFPRRSDVQLVIKSHNGHHHAHTLNPVLQQIKGDSRITWIDESMDQKRRYDLINACDCYVSLHRSEGFGLTMAEAMLLEKPVIATAYSGNLDFTTPENSFLCKYKLVSVGPNHHPYPAHGVWAEVNIDEAALWMQYVINNGAEAKARAVRGKHDILRNHSFDAVGASINNQLKNIEGEWDGNAMHSRQRGLSSRFLVDLLAYYAGGAWRRLKKMATHSMKSGNFR